MKLPIGKTMLLAAAVSILSVFPAMAAEIEGRVHMTDVGFWGWAWNSEDTNDTITVEFQLFNSASGETPNKTITIKADDYNEELVSITGDGWHWFDSPVSWDEVGGKPALVKVYGISTDSTKTHITDIKNPDAAAASEKKPSQVISKDAPESKETESVTEAQAKEGTDGGPGVSGSSSTNYKKGESLGMFTTTGYCNCNACSGGHGKTYSGTYPKANHTISADITHYPIGTKLMIGDIVYTVEDIGSSVTGNKIDIYYDSHEKAVAHGTKQLEVFRVIE